MVPNWFHLTNFISYQKTTHSSYVNTYITISVCSEGWLLLNRRCYFFSKQKASQVESDQTCRSLRGKLAAIKPTRIILMGYVRSLGVEYWVGLKKENRDRYQQNLWYWSDNAIEENIIDDGSNSCAKIGQTLSTESCSAELLWICEKEAEVSHTQ
ncbi:early activation antigen CD69-like [Dendropsophus ebraccatus]|uniref:early activation antigen CD69-like n=1 Tax=Dendropsophus ebraccatus TaxID=150705 RepID=UPI0038310258